MTSFQSEYFFNDEDDAIVCDSPSKPAGTGANGQKIEASSGIPDEIGPFRLGPVLGSGSTGLVRLGTHKETGFQVAFKIIEKQPLESKPAPWAKVKREIAVLKLIDHPNILKLYDVLETPHRLYLVLEWVKGGELFDFVIKRGKLDKDLALRLLAQVISGLECCHANSICHRDLKLENLLLDEKENIKIADFGLAQCMKGGELLKTGCGSPHYASPEILLGQSYDGKKTDVWSLGVILYTLVAGRLPFDDPSLPVLLKKIIKGHYEMPMSIPFDLSDLIRRMLVLDPKKRIRMEEIRNHPCFHGHPFQGSPSPSPSMRRTLNISITAETLDESILLDLESLGWGNKEDLRAKLLAPIGSDPNAPNLEKSFYSLLIERKATRLLGLARLSPKIKTRSLSLREPLSASEKALSVSAPTSPALNAVNGQDRGSAPGSPVEPKRPSFLRLESDPSGSPMPASPVAMESPAVPKRRLVTTSPQAQAPLSPQPPSSNASDSPTAALSGRFRTVTAARQSRRATIDTANNLIKPLSPQLHMQAVHNASGRASPTLPVQALQAQQQGSESPRLSARASVRLREESPKPPTASPQSACNTAGSGSASASAFSTPSPFRRLTMPSSGGAGIMSPPGPVVKKKLSFQEGSGALDTSMVEHSLEDMVISPPAASVAVGATYTPQQNPFAAPTDATGPASPHKERLLPELRPPARATGAVGRKHHLSPDKASRRMTIGSVSSDTGNSPQRLDFSRSSRDDTSSPTHSPHRGVKEHRVSGSPKMSWFRRIFARRPSLDVVNISEREKKAGSRSASPAGSPRVPIRISGGMKTPNTGSGSGAGFSPIEPAGKSGSSSGSSSLSTSPATHSRRRSLSAAEYARAAQAEREQAQQGLMYLASASVSPVSSRPQSPSATALPSLDASAPAIGSPHRVRLPDIDDRKAHRQEASPTACY